MNEVHVKGCELQMFNKLTMNGTKSSEALHSDLGGNSDSVGHSDLGGYSDLGVSFRFAGSIVEMKCLSALGIKTMIKIL